MPLRPHRFLAHAPPPQGSPMTGGRPPSPDAVPLRRQRVETSEDDEPLQMLSPSSHGDLDARMELRNGAARGPHGDGGGVSVAVRSNPVSVQDARRSESSRDICARPATCPRIRCGDEGGAPPLADDLRVRTGGLVPPSRSPGAGEFFVLRPRCPMRRGPRPAPTCAARGGGVTRALSLPAYHVTHAMDLVARMHRTRAKA